MSAARSETELAAMIERRVAGLPLEQILGWAEFRGLRMAVDPGVFVPRRRTEFLVDQAAVLARQSDRGRQASGTGGEHVRGELSIVVVDLCCGSGAVGVALVAALESVELHATDIDPAAVRCASRNVFAAGGTVYLGDLYEPLPASLHGCVDILVANAPYVPTEAIGLMPPEARTYEPLVALDGGPDGLDIQRRVAESAMSWLAPGGHLLIETSRRQAPQTEEAVVQGGLIPRVARSEALDATVVIGAWPAQRVPFSVASSGLPRPSRLG